MRQYDPEVDDYYSMDNTPDLFLTSAQVENALSKINVRDEEMEKAAVDLLRQSEKIHRETSVGNYSAGESLEKIQKLEKKFVQNYGIWPYQTYVYIDFYKQFSDE